jgi:hypothetical protein
MAFTRKRSTGENSSGGSSELRIGRASEKPSSSAKKGRREAKPQRERETETGAYHRLPRHADEERAQIESAAERAGLTVGSYVRSRALAKPTTRAVRRAPCPLAST